MLGPLRRRRWLVLAIVVLATASTYLVSSRSDGRYRASGSVLVQSSAVEGILNQPLLTTPDRATSDQAQLIRSNAVAERVIRKLGLHESPGALRGDVTATATTGSNIVTVTAERPSAKGAADVANAFVIEHLAQRSEEFGDEISDEIAKARSQLSSLAATNANAQQRQILRDGIARLSVTLTVPPSQGRQVDTAEVPSAPTRASPWRDALFALVISALFASTLAYTLEALTADERDDVRPGARAGA